MSASSDDKNGPNSASLNAKLTYHEPQRGERPGAKDRDAGEPAGIESGTSFKEPFGDADMCTQLLGKDIEPMGTPPWSDPPEEQVGDAVNDTFGSGERHTIKNG